MEYSCYQTKITKNTTSIWQVSWLCRIQTYLIIVVGLKRSIWRKTHWTNEPKIIVVMPRCYTKTNIKYCSVCFYYKRGVMGSYKFAVSVCCTVSRFRARSGSAHRPLSLADINCLGDCRRERIKNRPEGGLPRIVLFVSPCAQRLSLRAVWRSRNVQYSA